MEEAFFDTPLYREFARLDEFSRMPDESTILRFRHRLEKHKLADAFLATVNALLSSQGLMFKEGSAVDATFIAAPSSTKNKQGKRDPEMHSSKKGNQWHFGMKAHIGVDAAFGLVHTVRGTAGHVADVTEGNSLLHGEETVVFADAGYQGADKRFDANPSVRWQVAMRPGKRKKLDKANSPIDALIDKVEKFKASIRAKVEHAKWVPDLGPDARLELFDLFDQRTSEATSQLTWVYSYVPTHIGSGIYPDVRFHPKAPQA